MTSSPASSEQNKKLVFLGDSITSGFNLDLNESFPSLIEEKLRAKNLTIEVVNAGVSGDTSAAGLSRLRWILRSKVDYLFVALGANDGFRGVSPSVTKANLAEIIDLARAKYPGVTVILAGNLIPPSMGREFFEEFQSIYPALAKEKNVPLVPFLLEGVAGEPQLNLDDGIHPTAVGHKLIAENVWKVLQPILDQEVRGAMNGQK